MGRRTDISNYRESLLLNTLCSICVWFKNVREMYRKFIHDIQFSYVFAIYLKLKSCYFKKTVWPFVFMMDLRMVSCVWLTPAFDLLRRFGLLRLTTPTFETPTFVVGPFGLIIESVFIFIILEKKRKKNIEYHFFQLYFFLLCLNFHIYKIYLSLGLYGINTKFRHQKIIPKSTGKALKIANYTAWKY